MLSTEYTMKEIKSNLKNYNDYDYETDGFFEEVLEEAINKAKYEILWENIKDIYDNAEIQTISSSASDKSDFLESLSATQRFIFFAEVYFACYMFMKMRDIISDDEDIESESFSVEGYSQSTSLVSTKARRTKYYEQGRANMIKAGYETMRYSVKR